MRRLILFCFTVLLPAVVVGISNFTVFPDSAWAATLMLAVTVGIAAIFTWQSGDATAKVSRYCIAADFVICLILCANLAGHWILAREVSAAKQGVVERHAEEERQDKRAKEAAEREIAIAKAHADASRAERARLIQLPPEQRRERLAPRVPKKLQQSQPEVSATPEAQVTKRLTPEEVRDSWWWYLTGLAIAEVAASVLAGAILAGIWEWDRNHDGVADHLQQPRPSEFPHELDAGK